MLRIIFATVLATFLVGCHQPAFNPTPTQAESDSLTHIVQLTSDFDRAGEAYFSPDMKWIIVQAAKGDPRYQMYLADLHLTDTDARIGKPIRISPSDSRNTCGFFSPDGLSLIFASTAGKEDPAEKAGGYQRQGGQYRWDFPKGMEIYRADGWEMALGLGSEDVNLARHALTDNDAYDAECAFSPDGKRIVFCSNRTGDPELFLMDADGGNVKQLTHSPGYDGGPFFSPDGKSIVWRTDRKQKDLLQIHVADLVGDKLVNEKALTEDQNVNWAPYWHPDGQHIVYTTSMHGHQNYEIYLMRRDGSHKTRITFTEGFDGLPAISPDGKWLMWSSKRSGKVQVMIARFTLPKGS
jgi:Tol biopolymer transport system component